MYLCPMTIMLLEKRISAEFRHLGHGVFYSILVRSVLMYLQAVVQVAEAITGLLTRQRIGAPGLQIEVSV